MSGKRDSNSRPQPWQGCALPTELFPQLVRTFLLSEEEETRTPTKQFSLPPQSSASTNSATSPNIVENLKRCGKEECICEEYALPFFMLIYQLK